MIIGKKWANAQWICDYTGTRLDFPEGQNVVNITGET